MKTNKSGIGRLLWRQDIVWFPLGFSFRSWSPPRLKYYVSKPVVFSLAPEPPNVQPSSLSLFRPSMPSLYLSF